MRFVFTCPHRLESFPSADFTISENRGVVSGPSGSRRLDARVRLTAPCPFCGELHEYDATDLACPFGGNAT
jgi:hypothetical protein